MHKIYALRIAALAILAVLPALWSGAWAERTSGALSAAKLEVKVLEAQMPMAVGGRYESLYRMSVVSVLSSSVKVKPGQHIVVRASAPSEAEARDALKPIGWIGVVYLDRDPKASGLDADRQFVAVENGDGFESLPPTPPSASWIEYRREEAR